MAKINKHVFTIEVDKEEGETKIQIGNNVWRIDRLVSGINRIQRNAKILAFSDEATPTPFEAAIKEIYNEMYGLLGKAIAIVEDETGVKQE